MLLQLFSLYFKNLILTTILVVIFLGIWIGLRAMFGVDKTAKARQGMGGSAFGQVYNNMSGEAPDLDDIGRLKDFYGVI